MIECIMLNAICEDSKCACMTDMNFFLTNVTSTMEPDGNVYNEVCKMMTACEHFEAMSPCGVHSYCSETSGAAECVCEDGYEEDSEYAADRQDGPVNGMCMRINPCNSYQCSGLHEECIVMFDAPTCTCEQNFSPYQINNAHPGHDLGGFLIYDFIAPEITNFAEYYDPYEVEEVFCFPDFPCIAYPCTGENTVCITVKHNDVPHAFCECAHGYAPTNAVRNETASLPWPGSPMHPGQHPTCSDIDECITGNPCKSGQDCINTIGSYECECSSNWIPNTDEESSGNIPCVRLPDPVTPPTPTTIPAVNNLNDLITVLFAVLTELMTNAFDLIVRLFKQLGKLH